MNLVTNWAYFPLEPGTKTPAASAVGWQNLTPSLIPMAPPGNHGVVLTAADLILDIDPRNGGNESIKQIFQQFQLPRTRVVTTPSGGAHWYYKKPQEIKVRPKQKLYPGVDFLSQGQFVCGVGTYTRASEHSSEGFYVLSDDSPIAEIPVALLAVLDGPAEAVTDGALESLLYLKQYIAECKTAAPAIQGQRGDEATLNMAHRGRDLGLPLEEVYKAMRDHYNERCVPKWSEHKLFQKCENAFKYARGAAGQATPEAAFINFAPPPPEPAAVASDNVVSMKDYQDECTNRGAQLYELDCDSKLNVKPTLANVEFLLRTDPAWRGRFRFNEFSSNLEFTRRPRWRENKLNEGVDIGSRDIGQIRGWFSAAGHVKIEVSDALVITGAMNIATPYHPVKDYLNSVKWDGTPRLDRILIDTAGAEDSEYIRQVGKNILIGAVKRIFEPGCKLDHIAVLEGRQGTRKSTWVATLGGEWYSASELVRGDKDTYQNLRGRWFVELPEINATFSKADFNWLKGIISSANDVYRASYERTSRAVPRESIFVATINPRANREYLKDDENRRYWPVKTDVINIERLQQDRDQYFAEAVHRYKQNEQIWLSDLAVEQAKNQQESRREKDIWVEMLKPWVIQHASGFTPNEIYQAIGMHPDTAKSHQRQRLYDVLRELGCEFLPTGGAGMWKKEITFEDLI